MLHSQSQSHLPAIHSISRSVGVGNQLGIGNISASVDTVTSMNQDNSNVILRSVLALKANESLSPMLPSTASVSVHGSESESTPKTESSTATLLAAACSPASPYSLSCPANASSVLSNGAMENDEPAATASNHSSPTAQHLQRVNNSANSIGTNISRLSGKRQEHTTLSTRRTSVSSVPSVSVGMNGIQSTEYRSTHMKRQQQISDEDSSTRSTKVRVSSSSSGSRVLLHNVHSQSQLSPRHSLPHYQHYSSQTQTRRSSMNEAVEDDDLVQNLEDFSEAESDLHSGPAWMDGVSSSSSPRPSNPVTDLFGIRNISTYTLTYPAVFVKYQYLKAHTEEKVVIQAKQLPLFCFRKESTNTNQRTAQKNNSNTTAEDSTVRPSTSATATNSDSAAFVHSSANCIHLVRQSDILQVLAHNAVDYNTRAGLYIKLSADFIPSTSCSSSSTFSAMDIQTAATDIKPTGKNEHTIAAVDSDWICFNVKDQEFLPIVSFEHPIFGQGVLVSILLQSRSNSRTFMQQISKRLMNIEHGLLLLQQHQQPQQQPPRQESGNSPASPTLQSTYSLPAPRSRGNSPAQQTLTHTFINPSSTATSAIEENCVSANSSASFSVGVTPSTTSNAASSSNPPSYPMKLTKKKLSSAETIGDILDRLEEFHRIAAETGSPTEAYRIAGFAKGTISGYRAKIKEIQDEIGADLTAYRHMTYRDLKKMVRSGRHAANFQLSLAAAAGGVPVPGTLPPHPSLLHPAALSSIHHASGPNNMTAGSPPSAPISSTMRQWKTSSAPAVHSHSLAPPRRQSSPASANHILSYPTHTSQHPAAASAHHSHLTANHEALYPRHYMRS